MSAARFAFTVLRRVATNSILRCNIIWSCKLVKYFLSGMISGVSRVYTHMQLEKSVSISVRDTAKVQGREVRRMDLKGLVGQG